MDRVVLQKAFLAAGLSAEQWKNAQLVGWSATLRITNPTTGLSSTIAIPLWDRDGHFVEREPVSP